jgi:hypothetical protein
MLLIEKIGNSEKIKENQKCISNSPVFLTTLLILSFFLSNGFYLLEQF